MSLNRLRNLIQIGRIGRIYATYSYARLCVYAPTCRLDPPNSVYRLRYLHVITLARDGVHSLTLNRCPTQMHPIDFCILNCD